MTAARPLTMTDVVAALELADDHDLRLVRAALPDGIESALCDGVVYLDPGCEVGRYHRLLVDGVRHVVNREREQEARPHLYVVPEPAAQQQWQLPTVPRAAG